MKTAIPIHLNELDAIGIELLPFSELENGPDMPHRDDHYMFVMQRKGKSSGVIDFKNWELEGAALCLIAPGQVHHYLRSEDASGWLLFIDPGLISGEYRVLLDSFLHHHQVAGIPSDHFLFTLTDILLAILSEQTELQISILHDTINAWIGIFASLFVSQKAKKGGIGSSKFQLTAAFKQLIREQFREIKQVSDYASQLHITPLYLNAVSKEITGFPASYWLHQEIMLEAQRMLLYTDLDVKEIAFSLGFEDHAYFSRFFKKNSGVTAGAFRQSYHDLSNHRKG